MKKFKSVFMKVPRDSSGSRRRAFASSASKAPRSHPWTENEAVLPMELPLLSTEVPEYEVVLHPELSAVVPYFFLRNCLWPQGQLRLEEARARIIGLEGTHVCLYKDTQVYLCGTTQVCLCEDTQVCLYEGTQVCLYEGTQRQLGFEETRARIIGLEGTQVPPEAGLSIPRRAYLSRGGPISRGFPRVVLTIVHCHTGEDSRLSGIISSTLV